jgi:hypothetical protein
MACGALIEAGAAFASRATADAPHVCAWLHGRADDRATPCGLRDRAPRAVCRGGPTMEVTRVKTTEGGHGWRARPIVSCTCDGERTNRDNKSSDNGEYDLKHGSPPFRGSLLYKCYVLPSL